MNFNSVAIVSVEGSDYSIHFWYMSKVDAKHIMRNFNFNFLMFFFFIIYKIIEETTYY